VKSGQVNGEEGEENACKWCLYQLKKWMTKNGIDYNKVLNRIKDVVIKTCIAHEP
jgi:hypothetical protein